MEVREFFMQHLLLDFDNYKKGLEDGDFGFNIDTDAKRAANLAVSLYHISDHMPKKDFDGWYKNCPDLWVIQNIANIYKHNGLDTNRRQYKKKPPVITSSNAVWQTLVITIYQDEQGEYSIAHKEVIITLDDGSERELTPIFFNVFNFWINELEQLNISTVSHVSAPDRSQIQYRNSKGKVGDVTMLVRNSEEVNRKFLIKKYDYNLNKPVPFDLSNFSNIRMNIYEAPPKVLDWTLTDKQGREHKIEILLTEKQFRQYNSIDERLRYNYLQLLLVDFEPFKSLVEQLQKN